jgi:hypothetical protein
MRAKETGNQTIIRMLVEKGANTTPQEKRAILKSPISAPDEGANTTPQDKGASTTMPQENEATTTPATPEGPISHEPQQARKCFSCLCL